MSALTRPMYRKYYDVWAEHAARYGPRTALLYQVGGFFEIYDTENLTTGTTMANIREIAELCQLSLTVHAVDDTSQTLFGGFPDHALGKFERILVQAGFTVVVVVQKMRHGKVEDRVVDHIASPGCYVDGIGVARERRLVGVTLESVSGGVNALRSCYWAATALDVATGRIWFVEGATAGSTPDRLHQFLCIHPPAELVIWSDGGPGATAIADALRGLTQAVQMRCLTPSSAAVEEATLSRMWSPAGRRLPWIHTLPQARRCLSALMEFATDHVPSVLRCLDDPEAWVPDAEVRLGNAALEQLGLISLRSGGAGEKDCLLGMMDQCRSPVGRRLMRSRLMCPVSDVAVLRTRLDRIDAAAAVLDQPTVAALTERSLRSLHDPTRLWRRVELGTATMTEMAHLLESYEAMVALASRWPDVPANGLAFLSWVLARWNVSAVKELARVGGSVPVTALPWCAGTSAATLETKFSEGLAIRQAAIALCQEWSAGGRGEQLYLDDAEGGGFRVTGTKRRVAAVLTQLRDGGDTTAVITAYKTSSMLTNQAMDELTARHRKWMNAWTPMWSEAWSAAQAELVEQADKAHMELTDWCAALDVSWTVAGLARTWLWKRPELVEGGEESFVEATGLRHPILERLALGGAPYVPHSVALTPDEVGGVAWSSRGILLYGMNASGKSSLMKALGLAVLLAQCGFPVPATRLRLSPFTAIFTRILGNDNLWAGLSSFAVEMTEFREILRFADERSLVLGDELCSGTESLSATALVAAGVETLANRGTKFVFATHLHELATLPDIAALAGVKPMHLKVHYEAATDRLIYDRTLTPGSGSALYGLEVCRALDLPTGYLERATALRKALAGWQAPTTSNYSAGVVVDACAACGSTAGLETHHIVPQASAATASAAGYDINAPGNLVCLCAACHDDHHAGRLVIQRWVDTSAGRRLQFTRPVASTEAETVTPPAELEAWVREQKRLRIRVPTILRMAKQIHGVDVTEKWVRSVRA
jgi:DNA mismatch repair protein MutS